EDVQRGGQRQAGQQVGAGGAAAPQRLVDDDSGAFQLPGVAVAGVHDAVLDDGGGGGAAVPEQPVEVRDVHQQQVVAVGGRVPGVRHRPVRRVVLEVHGGHVPPGAAPAEPALGQPGLVRALEHHDVHV